MTESYTRRFLRQIAKYSLCKKVKIPGIQLMIVAEYANIFLTFSRPILITGFASFR